MESVRDPDLKKDILKCAGIGEVVNVKEMKNVTSFMLHLKMLMRITAPHINVLDARMFGWTRHVL